jgi:hypothetical protein
MGMSLEDIGEDNYFKMGKASYIFIEDPPKPHPIFGLYVFKLLPESGLYRIGATGKPIICSPDGYQLKKEFNNLKEALEKIYGDGVLLDILAPGSIWDKPGYWMMSVAKKHRSYEVIWGGEDKNSSLPFDLRTIKLSVTASSSTQGRLWLKYDFMNCDSCEAEISAGEDSAL